ncbi:hypothetical protein PVAP13_1NG386800 [Panicum virgatum]|uniref:Uncharacterized protein n=1 Tax=Panicum virgatum TaxID=38727 RepID=A0A8T0X1C8_PANVG|nr:hypothetical protein PVAP13_1NG386800 [Panicum virgatum]
MQEAGGPARAELQRRRVGTGTRDPAVSLPGSPRPEMEQARTRKDARAARTRKEEQAARGRALRPRGLEPGGGLVSAGGLDELQRMLEATTKLHYIGCVFTTSSGGL